MSFKRKKFVDTCTMIGAAIALVAMSQIYNPILIDKLNPINKLIGIILLLLGGVYIILTVYFVIKD